MEFKINHENRQFSLELSNRDPNAISETAWVQLVTDLVEVVLSYIPEEEQKVFAQLFEKLSEKSGRDVMVKTRTRPVKLTLVGDKN